MNMIKEYWIYLVASATVIAYLYDKGYALWMDKKKKQQAYNRFFTAVIKLFYSYLKHKKIYSEKSPISLPDEIYATIVKHMNSFNKDLEDFKEAVYKESEIIPEVSIQAHMLFDNIDRMTVMDKMKLAADPVLNGFGDKEDLAIKRAQFYATEEVYDQFFADIITDIKKYTTVNKYFIERLLHFNSEEYEKEANDEQEKILKRYFESLKRQNIIPVKDFNEIMRSLKLTK